MSAVTPLLSIRKRHTQGSSVTYNTQEQSKTIQKFITLMQLISSPYKRKFIPHYTNSNNIFNTKPIRVTAGALRPKLLGSRRQPILSARLPSPT